MNRGIRVAVKHAKETCGEGKEDGLPVCIREDRLSWCRSYPIGGTTSSVNRLIAVSDEIADLKKDLKMLQNQLLVPPGSMTRAVFSKKRLRKGK